MQAKKRYGQNFLIDNNVINKIVNEIGADKDSLIIEIGPGQGALTKHLVNISQVLAYEIDKDCIDILNKEIKSSNLTIKYGDILDANIKEDIKDFKYKDIYVVGNLPYYITTPIMLKLIETNLNVNKYVFMLQEEVADRYTSLSNNKEYNSLTVYLNYLFNTKKCFVVSNKSFNPIPKVSSAVITLTKKEIDYKPLNEEYFYYINKQIFKQKRKTLVNNLKDIFDTNLISKALNKLSFKPNIRAEELSINDIINLSDTLFILSNIYENANAKINLTLRVKDKIGDYHKLNSLMVKLDLSDILVFTKGKEDMVISNIDIKDNIILKTIKLFKETYQIEENVNVYLKKNIPLSAGLAGGSSDSSATLRGLNRLFNLNKSEKELAILASKLGSDNVFTLYNRTAIAKGRGELLDLVEESIKEYDIYIINPKFGLSTKEVYDNYKYLDKVDLTDDCLKALINGDNIESYIFNVLEESSLLNEEYKEFVDDLKRLNVISYQSGSGPSRFCFNLDLDTINILKEKYLVIKTKIIN